MMGLLKRHWYVVLIVVTAFALDQATKYVVIQRVAFRTSWPSEGFFRITHVGNTGSAFGLFGGQNLVLIVASVMGIGVLVYFYRAHPNPGRLVRTSLALMLAGAMGNLTDRMINGHVTDFIDIGPWYIFNAADASIVVGIIVLTVALTWGHAPPAPSQEAPPEEPTAVGAESSAWTAETAPDTPAHDQHSEYPPA